jgi:hypothetical protein
MAAEVLEGSLVGVEELRQRLVGAGLIEATPAEAQREHEDVQDARLLAEAHRGSPGSLSRGAWSSGPNCPSCRGPRGSLRPCPLPCATSSAPRYTNRNRMARRAKIGGLG